MTPFLAPVCRGARPLVPAVLAAAGWLVLTAPAGQASPLPPLNTVTTAAPAPGAGGPKRPGPVVAPTPDPAEANLRQGGPRRPGAIPPGNQQTAEMETAERLGKP